MIYEKKPLCPENCLLGWSTVWALLVLVSILVLVIRGFYLHFLILIWLFPLVKAQLCIKLGWIHQKIRHFVHFPHLAVGLIILEIFPDVHVEALRVKLIVVLNLLHKELFTSLDFLNFRSHHLLQSFLKFWCMFHVDRLMDILCFGMWIVCLA